MSRAVDLLPARSTAATETRQGEKTPGGYCTADSFCRQLSFTPTSCKKNLQIFIRNGPSLRENIFNALQANK